jgi:hypothetical protein
MMSRRSAAELRPHGLAAPKILDKRSGRGGLRVLAKTLLIGPVEKPAHGWLTGVGPRAGAAEDESVCGE